MSDLTKINWFQQAQSDPLVSKMLGFDKYVYPNPFIQNKPTQTTIRKRKTKKDKPNKKQKK